MREEARRSRSEDQAKKNYTKSNDKAERTRYRENTQD